MRRFSFFALLFSAIFVLSGCLTTQYKEYKFHFDSKTSGTLTITFTNIFAQIYEDEDPDSVLQYDYEDLVNNYLEGEEIEGKFPDAEVVSKELYEENHQLCAKIVLAFDDPQEVHLFKYDRRSPWMFSIPSDEEFFDSNGEKSAEFLDMVFWNRRQHKKGDFSLTTSVSEPQDYDKSLLATWKANPVKWKGNR